MRGRKQVYRRRRVGAKFYIFLFALAALIISVTLFFALPRTARVKWDSISSAEFLDCAVIFNEAQIDLPDNERLIFSVPNNSAVQSEELIGEYYKKGYVTAAFEAYVSLRQSIVSYQNDVLLRDIYQNELNEYAIAIDTVLTELQTFDSAVSDYITLNNRLISILSQRQDYIRENYPADEQLQSLYDEEQERLNALDDWIVPIRAVGNGFVSWYLNEAYAGINTNTAAGLEVKDIRKLLESGNVYKNVNSSNGFVVRIILDGSVYFAAVMKGDVEPGRTLTLYSAENEYACQVVAVNGSGSTKAVIIKTDCSVEPLLEHRVLRLAQQPVYTGLTVPESYIVKTVYDGNYIYADVDGVKEKVQVNIVASAGGKAIVKAVQEGKLHQDSKVYSK